jgi:hypothetical protein
VRKRGRRRGEGGEEGAEDFVRHLSIGQADSRNGRRKVGFLVKGWMSMGARAGSSSARTCSQVVREVGGADRSQGANRIGWHEAKSP